MADKAKSATINVEAILLEKLDFERNQVIADDVFEKDGSINTVKLNVEANVDRIFSDDKTKLLLKFTFKIYDKDKTISVLCRMAGVFFQTEDGSMNLEEFAKINAPTFLLPYIRENISSVTMKAGLPPIIIPPMNMVKLMSENPIVERKE